jgi:hypothetical protein
MSYVLVNQCTVWNQNKKKVKKSGIGHQIFKTLKLHSPSQKENETILRRLMMSICVWLAKFTMNGWEKNAPVWTQTKILEVNMNHYPYHETTPTMQDDLTESHQLR